MRQDDDSIVIVTEVPALPEEIARQPRVPKYVRRKRRQNARRARRRAEAQRLLQDDRDEVKKIKLRVRPKFVRPSVAIAL